MSWAGRVRGARWAALILALALAAVAPSLARARSLTVFTDQLAGPPLMGLGVELDPYDHFQPTPTQWNLTFQRLDFMRPGFLRVVEPAYELFPVNTSVCAPVVLARTRLRFPVMLPGNSPLVELVPFDSRSMTEPPELVTTPPAALAPALLYRELVETESKAIVAPD